MILISLSSIYAKDVFVGIKKFPEQILHLEQMFKNQRNKMALLDKKKEIYDSTEDPFYKDKEVESHTRIAKTSYLKKSKRQILTIKKEIDQLAPPSPTYTWNYEYYFDQERLYAVCFRYYINNHEFSVDTKSEVTEILVFFPKGSKSFAYKKTYPFTGVGMTHPMQLEDQFVSFDLDEKDESGMKTAALRDGIQEILKRK